MRLTSSPRRLHLLAAAAAVATWTASSIVGSAALAVPPIFGGGGGSPSSSSLSSGASDTSIATSTDPPNVGSGDSPTSTSSSSSSAPTHTAHHLTAPPSVPTKGDVSVPLDASFLSFSIESAYFDYFFGTHGKPNQFTFALLQNLADRMGGQYPMVRPGGNTMDLSSFDPNSSASVTRITDPVNSLTSVIYGPAYYQSFDANFPPGQKLVVTLNFKNNTFYTASEQVAAAVQYAASRIAYFELGNEVGSNDRRFEMEAKLTSCILCSPIYTRMERTLTARRSTSTSGATGRRRWTPSST